jgi:predicted NAD/FAD-binding protein
VKRVAVIGGGVAGLTAAYKLRRTHDVTLFERELRLGGHAHTIEVDSLGLDVGFMVLNDRTYPAMHALLEELGCADFGESEMSFGMQDRATGLAYALNLATGKASAGLQPILGEVARFLRRVRTRDLGDTTLGELAGTCSQAVRDGYLWPMAAAIWSTPPADLAAFPARFVIDFYRHHGMLGEPDPPRWQHVRGGSRRYVARLSEGLTRRKGARCITRDPVTVDGEPFDVVVVATHADEALALLADPTDAERAALGAWRYQANDAVLHSDDTVMPADRAAWASWNVDWHADGPVAVTYDLGRLQGHVPGAYFLTLNPRLPLDRVHAHLAFHHPVYSAPALAARSALAPFPGASTYFCGSYMGAGFHEDAIRSALAVVSALEEQT